MSSFETFMNENIPSIDNKIEYYVNMLVTDERQVLVDAMSYSCQAKGKRIRPLIAILIHHLFSQDTEKILPFACATEMIHTYSLIHDDLPAMDDDDMRRGQPTCHKKFGEDIAILAGDTLNTLAFEVMANDLNAHFNAEDILYAITEFCKTLGVYGIAGGQVIDLKSNKDTGNERSLETMHTLKTGALIRSCMVIPAILNKADNKCIDVLDSLANSLGLLFQVVDDILDETATSEALGKTAGKDKAANKLTYTSLLGLKKAEDYADDLSKNCLEYCKTLINMNLDTRIIEDLIIFVRKRTH